MGKDRPCYKCGNIIPADAAAHLRKTGLRYVKCEKCGSSINLYGEPCRKQKFKNP